MKKIFILIFLGLILQMNLAYATSLEESKKLNYEIYKIKKDIWKNGEEYKKKVLKSIDNYKKKLSQDENKIKILDYTISKIKDLKFKYGIITSPTPLLSTPKFSKFFYNTGTGPLLDDYEQIDPVATVLLTGTIVSIEDELTDSGNLIYQVQTNEYFSYDDGFIDSRFVKILDTVKRPKDRDNTLPEYKDILINLLLQTGYDYIRGGTIPDGVPDLAKYYKPNTTLDKLKNDRLILNGFDCSGLLHYATNGYSPRNTSQLINFGTGIEIKGLTSDEIISKLKPLDLIVWKGHVMIIVSKDKLIESRHDFDISDEGFLGGVRLISIKTILDDLVKNKIGVNDYNEEVPEGMKKFVIRRWYK